MQTLRKLNETLGVTVVFVSHDPDDAQYASQLIHLSDGKLTDGTPSETTPSHSTPEGGTPGGQP
jgi:putative ABC transport system ATP-binding protein